MMTTSLRYLKRPIGWTLLIVLICIAPVLGQSAPATLPNLVLSTTGDVYLQRAGWAEAVVLYPLTDVYAADIIDATFGEVILKCADGKILSVTNSTTPPCEEIPKETRLEPPDRAGVAETNIPYLISPRGKTTNPQPVIRWSLTTNAASYRIDIVSKGASIFGTDAKQKPIVTEPSFTLTTPLEPGLYSVGITALNSSGVSVAGWVSDNAVTSLEIVTPSPEFLQNIAANEALDLGPGMPVWMRDFLIAETYFASGFYADAIERLQPLMDDATLPARVFLKLGTAYNTLELYGEAGATYKQAIAAALAESDLLALAEAHRYLSYFEGDVAAQWCHWNEAYVFFVRLNDVQQITALDRHGARLNQLLNNTPPSDCSVHL